MSNNPVAGKPVEGQPVADADLDGVAGGFDVLQQVKNVGTSALEGGKKGADIGILGGPVFMFAGAGAGAFVGTVSGVMTSVGEGVNEAVDGIKNLMK
ncbi:hypothetical protein ACLBXM_08865 [Xanthobacteraceae bacterium A53D]